MTPVVRVGRAAEADALSALCFRSKAHWGYDQAFMEQCRASLRVSPLAIRDRRVFVAAGTGDCPLGVAQIDLGEREADLGLLFVDPPAIGRGVGRLLLRRATICVHELGVRRLTVLADPFAAPFYERMGARFIGMAPSDAVPGRSLPLYEIPL
jgi:GNAT superfamily N-acetyltransferase